MQRLRDKPPGVTAISAVTDLLAAAAESDSEEEVGDEREAGLVGPPAKRPCVGETGVCVDEGAAETEVDTEEEEE